MKLIKFLWSLRRQFAKYFIIGVVAFVLDIASLVFLKEVLSWPPVWAVVVNQVFIIAFVFLMNKYWSFKHPSQTGRQLFRYGMVLAFDYAFAVATMYVFSHIFDFDYRLVRTGAIVVQVSWNFFLYKYWVYHKEEAPASAPTENHDQAAN